MGTILSADTYKNLLHDMLFLQKMSTSFSRDEQSSLCAEIDRVQAELADIFDTFLILASNSRNTVCAEIADAYLDYSKRIGEDFRRILTSSPGLQNKSEDLFLYAEFAVDFAGLTVKHALLSALYAKKIQTEES